MNNLTTPAAPGPFPDDHSHNHSNSGCVVSFHIFALATFAAWALHHCLRALDTL